MPVDVNEPGGRVDEPLRRLAELVRTLYVLHYRRFEAARTGRPGKFGAQRTARWDGGTDSAGRRCLPIWPRVASAIAELGADPEAYMAAQFHQLGLQRPPWPNQLYSPQALDRYREYACGLADSLGQDLDVQHNLFLLEVEKRTLLGGAAQADAGLQVLADETIDLSSLYRYALAEIVGEPGLCDRYHTAAFDQYFFAAPAYDRAWCEFIPDGLKAEAAALRAALTDGGKHRA